MTLSPSNGGEPSGRARQFAALLILLALIGGAIYFIHRQGLDWRRALASIGESSAETATTAKVKTALALSRTLSVYDIDVSTRQGVVTLSGQVPTEDIGKLAAALAADTSGVDRVESSLEVNPAARPDPEIERLGQRVAELELKMLVSDALRQALSAGSGRIEVSVSGKVVTLSGAVDTEDGKEKAERIAGLVAGVESVRNSLRVAPLSAKSPIDADERLAREVQFELYLTRAMNLDGMQIASKDGQVTLAGRVGSPAERLLAERIAREVSGVRSVVNQLRVEKPSDATSETSNRDLSL